MKYIIGEKEYEVERLNVLNLTTEIGDKVKETLMVDAVKMASYLSGVEKANFMTSAYRTLPYGEELLEKIQNFLQSVDGYKWMINKATGEEIEITDKNIESYIPMVEFMIGANSDDLVDLVDKEGKGEQAQDPLTVTENPTGNHPTEVPTDS